MVWLVIIVLLLLLCIWGGGFLLEVVDIPVSTTWQVVLSALVVLAAIGWVIFRRIRAQRRAKQLEAEILKQSEQQAATARPDRRAEIIELQKRVQQGIQALQQTKLGKRHGRSALYALPWYAIIGPPGAGKTTALKHSGLVFPFQDPSGGAVRGVGGTRNCDWWFTNEAILLDTAGRYATDEADREEWLAFLGLLRKHRPKKPINGLLVAVSISELFEASDEQISTYAVKLRARIDEIMTRLDMVLPVYVVFTKCDLIGGFVEFFGDLKKSERDQILGATLPLDSSVGEAPGKSFATEFERLVHNVHARSHKVIGKEPQPAARAKIFQFPLELKSLSGNLEQFIEELFRQNSFQENPMFRGFYLTSGTQEGKPFERMMGSMARALGIRQPPMHQAPTESKSYFVTDVFRRVVFPDKDLAGRTASELRRQRLVRGAVAAAAVLIGSLFVLPGAAAMGNNRELVEESASVSRAASGVDWGGPGPGRAKVAKLDDTRELLQRLDRYEKEGPPWSFRWGMYQGETVRPALREAYVAHLEKGMADPAQKKLEAELTAIGMTAGIRSSQYGQMYGRLKLYLMLSERDHLDIEWATPRLTKVWADLLRDGLPETLKAMTPHVRYYLELMKQGAVEEWPAIGKLVSRARSVLLRAPRVDRLYELLVRDANEEVAAITRQTIFYRSFAQFVTSRDGDKVDGAYTREGWQRVQKLLSSERSRLTGEQWVLGEKRVQVANDIEKQIDQLKKLYFDRYQAAWREFLADMVVERPDDMITSLEELTALNEPEWPYLRMLRILHENVSLRVEPKLQDATAEDLKEKAEEKAEDVKDEILGKEKEEEPRKMSSVEKTFQPMTRFGIPKEGDDPASTGLAQYQAILADLVGVMTDLRESDTPGDTSAIEKEFESAFRATTALLTSQSGFTRPLLSPYLLRPITGAWSSVSNDIGSAAGGLWELSVWEDWHTNLEPHYPFSDVPHDAKFDDFVKFFEPETGSLWSFYDDNLKWSLRETGDEFVPTRRFDSKVSYNGEFLSNCLARGKEITETLFDEETKKPKVEFQLNLHSVSRNVSRVSLSVDGKEHIYRNAPEEWLSSVWPAEEGSPGAILRIVGDSQLDEEIIRQGPFGLYRLIDAATSIEEGTAGGAPAGESTLVLTYEFPSEDATLKLDLKSRQGPEALSPDLFRDYDCPRVITAPGN